MNRAPENQSIVDTFAASDGGHGMHENGDSFVVAELKRAASVSHSSRDQYAERRFGNEQAQVLMVADTHRNPKRAKAGQIVIDEVLNDILNAVPWSPKLDVAAEANLCHRLKQSFVHGNDALRNTDGEASLTMAFVRWPNLFLVDAGRNHAFLIRDGEVYQVVRTEENHRNTLGGIDRFAPQLTSRSLQRGDTVLLCSATLARHLNRAQIAEAAMRCESAEDLGKQLLQTGARSEEARNATIAIARFRERSHEQVSPQAPGTYVTANARALPAATPKVATSHANVATC